LVGEDVARRINEAFPESATRTNETDVWVEPDSVAGVARFLKDADGLDFSYLSALTAVDYVEYFELVYHLLSMRRNHSVVLKTQIYGRESPTAQSVIGVWQGADLQEREVWDLMGIRFHGHPNMKRILLWEGFPGHPLKKDFLG
jgi:NADH:ubiquinone oxidoreductase subunit C